VGYHDEAVGAAELFARACETHGSNPVRRGSVGGDGIQRASCLLLSLGLEISLDYGLEIFRVRDCPVLGDGEFAANVERMRVSLVLSVRGSSSVLSYSAIARETENLPSH